MNKKTIIRRCVIIPLVVLIMLSIGFVICVVSGLFERPQFLYVYYTPELIQERLNAEKIQVYDAKSPIPHTNVNGVNCEDSDCDKWTFSVYKTSLEASRAFQDICDGYFSEISEQEPNFVRGDLSGVCDAAIDACYYRTGNLIISKELIISGYFGTEENAPAPLSEEAKKKREANVQKTISKIKKW